MFKAAMQAASVALLLMTYLSTPARGEIITYRFELSTKQIIDHPAGPFSLDIQLAAGSDTKIHNTVIVSDIHYVGGASLDHPILYGDGASVDNAGLITLDMGESQRLTGYAGFRQQFSAGDAVTLTIRATTNLNGPDVYGLIYPDTLSVALKDASGNDVPTLGYSVVGDIFISLSLESSNPQPHVFASDGTVSPSGGGPPIVIPEPTVINEVPEPRTYESSIAGLGALGAASICLRLVARNRRPAEAQRKIGR